MTVLPFAWVALCAAGAAPAIDVAVRADPIVFALGGWSLGVDVATDDLVTVRNTRMRASIAAFHVEVPELLVPVVASPPDGLRVLEDAVQVALRFELGGGWWIGPEVYAYRLAYSRGDDRAFANEAYAHASVGWRWFFAREVPLLEFFFVEPWATIGLPVFGTGGAVVGDVAVRDRGFNWHATVSVGVDVW